jgi:hypothetical protein
MKQLRDFRKRLLAGATVTAIEGVGGASTAVAVQGESDAPAGTSADNPIMVSNVSDVPAGAVEDEVSTYLAMSECEDVRSWTVTDVNDHPEYQYSREIPAVQGTQEYIWSIDVPQSHTENRTRVATYTPGKDGVKGHGETFTSYYQPQADAVKYEYAKFTRTKVGKKDRHGDVNHGDYGPWTLWTLWTPKTHVSWTDYGTDANPPSALGEPAFHAQDNTGHERWYRQWQAQLTGEMKWAGWPNDGGLTTDPGSGTQFKR